MRTLSLTCLALLVAVNVAEAADSYSWRYYRPTNTGIQGDSCEAIHVGPDANPWISGYHEGFEEGGIARLIVSENRWINVSNVDYPVIGHPDLTAISRVSDIDSDGAGGLWMSTGRGGLYYDPAVGPSSLRRFGADNSAIHGGWNKGVEVSPDGSVWFSSYSTAWGGGGISKYTPSNNQWQSFESYGGGPLAIQPKPGGGYYVWTMLGIEAARYNSSTATWTVLPKADGNPAFLPGKNLTDSAGNTWMYRWTNAAMNEMVIDLRRPDGTWVGVPPAPFDAPFNNASCLRAISPSLAYVVDGGGQVYRYNGAAWTSLGYWQATVSSCDIDADANGNLWVCGSGGAARRDVATGVWQRYRVTNTSQYDFFNNDLTLDANGGLYAAANAASGYGGMVRFDGLRWIGINNHHYGLGIEWPFPTDNTSKVYLRPSNGQLVLNPMFNGLHTFDGANWSDLGVGNDSVNDIVEDSLGRLWTTYYGKLLLRTGSVWTQVSEIGALKLRKDPTRPGTIWAMGDTTLMRTDGTTFFTRDVTDFPDLDPQSDQFKGFVIGSDGMVWIGAYTVNLPDNSAVIRLNPATGTYTSYRQSLGWPFPGQYAMPLAATPDGKIWMQYDSDFLVAQRGLFWFDGTNVGSFPAPPGGEAQWGGLPHAAIMDLETRTISSGYELWMSCASRGIAVLKVTNASAIPTITGISPASVTVNQGSFTLTVTGSNFVSGTSTIRWNGSTQTTTYVSPTQLSCTIANATNQTIGLIPITVANGPQISNAVSLQARGTVVPTAFATITGTLVSGGLAELGASDDARLGVRPSFSGARLDPNIVVEGSFPAPVTSAAQLRFEAELLATVGPNDLKVQGFDYASNAWVDLVTSTTNTTDTTYIQAITSSTGRYISGGQMKMRVWVRARGANGSRAWQCQIDRMAIHIDP